MKKFLISILVILLMVLTYFLVLKDITIGSWKNKNVGNIKELDSKLNEQIDTATKLNNQKYPDSIANLETAIKNLKIAKEKYQSKLNYMSDNVELGVVQIKEYKIERLWVTLGNYAKEENVELKMDIVGNSVEDGVYDLEITLIGGYIGITDFIYDIEKDDTLGFKILNFKILPNATAQTTETQKTTSTEVGKIETDVNNIQKEDTSNVDNYVNNVANGTNTTNSNTNTNTTNVDTSKLRATFKIEDVGIEFN